MTATDQIAHVGICEIIFEVFHPVWKTYLNVTDGRTDRQTTYCGIILA